MNINDYTLVPEEDFLLIVRKRLDFLYDKGLTQTQIAVYLNVTDRTIRSWENLDKCPKADKYYNLCRLCKKFGA